MSNGMWYWVVLIVANIPLYLGLGWLIFRSWSAFWDGVRYSIEPDEWSLFKGELLTDWGHQAQMWAYLILCALMVYFEHEALQRLVFGD